jgi:cell division protein ZapA
MPDLKVIIGGRNFIISCNPGEESAAEESANLLSAEADLLNSQLGRLPEDKMLLLSGLLLGDKIKSLKREQSALEEALKTTQTKLNELSSMSDTTVGKVNKPVQDFADDNLPELGEDKVLKELQAISDMLDTLILTINIPYPKDQLEINHSVSEEDAQDSFL